MLTVQPNEMMQLVGLGLVKFSIVVVSWRVVELGSAEHPKRTAYQPVHFESNKYNHVRLHNRATAIQYVKHSSPVEFLCSSNLSVLSNKLYYVTAAAARRLIAGVTVLVDQAI